MTLGQIFRQKREESGRSLEQLAALTKIHIKILTALEADIYSSLPARAFTRGFIVNYAKALKLDPEKILKDHHDFLEQHFQERKDRDQGHQGYVFEGKELEQNRRWMTIGATIAVIFAAATLFIFKPQNHKHKEQHKEFEEETQLNADGEPIEAPMPPPTLNSPSPKETASVALPPMGSGAPVSSALPPNTQANSSSKSDTKASNQTPTPALAAVLAVHPTATPTNTPKPSPSVAKASPTPNLTKASPAASATPAADTPDASPTPAVKEDKLNKGDDLTPKEAKYKITFQSKDDLWIRYQSDDKPIGTIILRKDRYLVIKAKDKIIFETNHPESIRYKSKGSYQDLPFSKGKVENDASIKEDAGANLGAKSLPEQVPSPAAH